MKGNTISRKDSLEEIRSSGNARAGENASSGKTGAGDDESPMFTGPGGFKSTASGGTLAISPMKVVMKLLYAARYARPDLVRACQHLALFFTRWTPECDKKLNRLMCFVQSTLKWRHMGWVGDNSVDVEPHLFADADFAGCTVSSRSTTGVHLCMRGPSTCFPLAGVSKRQGCVKVHNGS